MSETDQTAPSFAFGRELRLRRPEQFQHLRRKGLVKYAGPLRVTALPNDLGHSRLGLAISRRLGNAVRRNRVKRLVREAFRLTRHRFPAACDLVVSAKAHEPAALEDYQRWLGEAMEKLQRQWSRASSPPPPPEHEREARR
jgi:ribonuclease P protein component